jgi:type I restriction enzyme S subunit
VNRLDRLIKELCPNGVEYSHLESVCNISKGVQFNKSNMQDKGTYPVINGGINLSGYIDQFNQNENTITISQGGASAGYVNWLTVKFWAGAHCYILKPSECILNRYLFHFLKSREYKLQECQYGAGIPALAKSTLAELFIPIPPLPVQCEIVRILDNFTELTAELAAELTARKKQYEYYRNKLLTFGDEVEWKTLSDVLKIKNGKDYKQFGEGNIPVYGSGGIMTYIDTFVLDKPSVLIPRKGSIDKLYYVDVPFWTVDTIFYTEIYTNVVIPKFVFYYLQKEHLEQYNTAGGVPSLTQTVLNRIAFPVPPLSEQERIVSILDKFDALVNDISIGLPAEIQARQKQYEYYRDMLLSFKEAANEQL